MLRSLFSGVAGLKSHQTRMDTIGNNIANVNTYGFKSGRTTFADTLNQTLSGASAPNNGLGGTNPKQIGLGTGIASVDTIFTDGSVQSTGKNTDLCLSGNGLFVVKNNQGTYYTRDGAFEFDAAGNYVLPGSGLFVQGWMGTDGTVNASGATTNITIQAGKSMAAKASTKATLSNNLSSTTAIDSTATSTITVYDSQGNAHDISLTYKKTAANAWSITAGKSASDTTCTDVALTGGTLAFDANGACTTTSAGTLTLTLNNSATIPAIVLVPSGLTQYSSESTVKSAADGNADGTLKSVSIDATGTITGTYTNGVKQTEAQIAIAQFNNASGLTKTGTSLYQESNNSGTANVKTASALGCNITPSALEMSNVDLSNEFSDMIITQRGFQSNSKIITVGDEMLETLINMKR